MSLFEQLKADQLKARKEGAKAIAASLGVVIAESSKNDKTPSDEVVMATIRKLIKSLDEILAHRPDESDAVMEKELLENYVPTMLTRSQLEMTIALWNDDASISLKNMKAIKERLEAQAPGRIDGKLLADVVKNIVASTAS